MSSSSFRDAHQPSSSHRPERGRDEPSGGGGGGGHARPSPDAHRRLPSSSSSERHHYQKESLHRPYPSSSHRDSYGRETSAASSFDRLSSRYQELTAAAAAERPLGRSMDDRPSSRKRPYEMAGASLESSQTGSSVRLLDARPREASSSSRRYEDSVSMSRMSSTIAEHYNERRSMDLYERDASLILGLRKFNNWVKTVMINTSLETLRTVFSKTHSGSVLDAAAFSSHGQGQGQGQGYGSVVASVPIRALDLCCGKGGDLQKWLYGPVQHYVGLDIAPESINAARLRLQEFLQESRFRRSLSSLRSPFTYHFHAVDCFHRLLERHHLSDLSKEETPAAAMPSFHVVSCMFALHYAFETRQSANLTFYNVSQCLLPDGFFIFTLPSHEQLSHMRRSKVHGNGIFRVRFVDDDASSDRLPAKIARKDGDPDVADAKPKCSTQNVAALHPTDNSSDKEASIALEEGQCPSGDVSSSTTSKLADHVSLEPALSIEDLPSLDSIHYYFTLEESVTNCPEFSVPLPFLRALAKKHNFSLRYRKSFAEFYEDFRLKPHARDMLARMRLLRDDALDISEEEAEAIQLYDVFILQKIK